MKVGALLTSAGINIGLCVLFWSLYSILRKQPQNVKVYFGRSISKAHRRPLLERFVPSPSWIVSSLHCTEDEMLTTAGLDAVVFNRVLVFRCIQFYLYLLCHFNIYCSLFMRDLLILCCLDGSCLKISTCWCDLLLYVAFHFELFVDMWATWLSTFKLENWECFFNMNIQI
jgi:hypothetical protein